MIQMDNRHIPEKTIALAMRCVATVAPPTLMPVSDWCDANIVMPDDAPTPGNWRTDLTPFSREPMNACGRGRHSKIVMMCASQLMKTAVMLNYVAYRVACNPCKIKWITYSKDEARKFSKDRIDTLAELAPALKPLMATSSNDPDNTKLRKEFPGGCLSLAGANSPRDLAGTSEEVIIADEVSGFPQSAGTEGDPLGLVEKRQSNYPNRRTIYGSTPSIDGECRISTEYENSTQEQWCVPCPSCGDYQPFDWKRLTFNDGPDESGMPEMACMHCGSMHNEYEWKAGQIIGKWIARKEHETTRGFHLNAMASPWLTWRELIVEFLDAVKKGSHVLQTFINTRLAETYEETCDKVQETLIDNLIHEYGCDVPEDVCCLTCGVDVQHDRLEYEIVGWGVGNESWGIEYGMIPGDPNFLTVWNSLDQFLQRRYKRKDGVLLPIVCTAVDSGFATHKVYAFTKKRVARYIFAVDGRDGPSKNTVLPFTRVGKNKDVYLFPVGSDSGKDLLLSRLSLEVEGPEYCHFPLETDFEDGRIRGYNKDYFDGLFTERRVPKSVNGKMVFVWRKKSSHSRNEPLDCRVYASAALVIRNPNLDELAVSLKTPLLARPTQAQKPAGRRRGSPGIEV